MKPTGPLNGLPIACTLTVGAGNDQIERWRTFDDEHALGVERTETRVAMHYARTGVSIRLLRELIATEIARCSFVDWMIDDSQPDLRLVVSGTPDQLAALNVGSGDTRVVDLRTRFGIRVMLTALCVETWSNGDFRVDAVVLP